MTWRDRLLPASYRGVPFVVQRDEVRGGRRIALHEYPLRDQPYAEDLGRRARAYSIEAVVIGPGYDLALSALRYALDARGPGLLVHPVYGLLSVVCAGYRATLTSAEGGAARVRIDFDEAGVNAFPLSLLDTLGAAVGRVGEALARVREWVQVAYVVAGLGAQVLAAASALLGALLATVDALAGQVGLSASDRAAQAAGLGAAQRASDATAASPALVGALIVDQVSSLRTLAGAQWPAYQALRPLATWGAELPAVPALTGAGQAAAANQSVIVGAVRDAAVANACAAALGSLAPAGDAAATAALPPGVPATAQDLRALQGVLLGLIDGRQAEASDAAYDAWDALRQAVTRDLTERALVAPQARSITLAATLPAVVVAYRVHGDAGRADEIVRRNGVRHPLCVPGGVPVEVRV